MIINFKNIWFSNEPRQKNLISQNMVDKPGIFSAYLLFSGRKKDQVEIGAYNE